MSTSCEDINSNKSIMTTTQPVLMLTGDVAWTLCELQGKPVRDVIVNTMGSGSSRVSDSFIKDVVECFRYTVSREDLQRLVTDNRDWKMVLKEAKLPRKVANMLREALKQLAANMAKDDQRRKQEDKQAREKFLALFPPLKTELLEDVRKLRALADQVNKLHKACTVTNVVASSTGILAFVGAVLAPFTAGASLGLTAAGTALGVASAATGITSTAVERTRTQSFQKEAQSLISAVMKKLTTFSEDVGHFVPKVFSSTEHWKQFLRDIGKTICAIKLAMGNRELVSIITASLSIGHVMIEGSARLIQSCFAGLARAITRGSKAFGWVAGPFCFGLDIYNLVEDSKNLHKGGKSDLGAALQEQAQALETILEHFSQTYRRLNPAPKWFPFFRKASR